MLRRDGTWAAVPVSPPGTRADAAPPVLVNVGDLLSYWTNGLFRSALHRVVFPRPAQSDGAESAAEPRYSIAFFCHPVSAARLDPVPSERVRRHVPAAEAARANPHAEASVMTAGEHLRMRLRESYGTLYDEQGD